MGIAGIGGKLQPVQHYWRRHCWDSRGTDLRSCHQRYFHSPHLRFLLMLRQCCHCYLHLHTFPWMYSTVGSNCNLKGHKGRKRSIIRTTVNNILVNEFAVHWTRQLDCWSVHTDLIQSQIYTFVFNSYQRLPLSRRSPAVPIFRIATSSTVGSDNSAMMGDENRYRKLN